VVGASVLSLLLGGTPATGQSPEPGTPAPMTCPGLQAGAPPSPPVGRTPDPSHPADLRDAPEPPPSPPVGAAWRTALVHGDGPEHCEIHALTAWSGGFAAVVSIVDDALAEAATDDVAWPLAMLISSDGDEWELHRDVLGAWVPPLEANIRIAAWGDALVLVGTTGRRMVAWTSGDGATWTPAPDQPSLGPDLVPDDKSLGIMSLVVVDDLIVVEGMLGPYPFSHLRWRSTDGLTWRRDRIRGPDRTAVPDDLGPLAIGPGPDGFLAGIAGGRLLYGSPRGRDWRRVGRLPKAVYRDPAYRAADGTTYAVGTTWTPSEFGPDIYDGTVLVYRSKDLRAWEVVWRGTGKDWQPDTLAVGDSGILISGMAKNAGFDWTLTSTNGTDWHLSAGWPSMVPGSGATLAAIHDDTLLVAGGPPVWVSSIATQTGSVGPESR